jgi:uncharacterized membrane protein
VVLSGVAEAVLGAGLFVDRTRRPAAWGLVVLLVAVFPANVHTAVTEVSFAGTRAEGVDPPRWALWARLPFQAVLVVWAWLFTRPDDG